jgi:hypothetical protein
LRYARPFFPTRADPTRNIAQLRAASAIPTPPFCQNEIGKKGTRGYAG